MSVGRAAGYRGADEVAARVAALAGPGVRVRTGGVSRRGVPIQVVEIGDRGPASAILGGIHPIEWIGVEVALALLERLVAAPPPGRRLIAVPLINVDGYREVEDDLRADRRRWHRCNAGGVDLNRNYPTHFAASRRLPGGWNWGGPAPISEPETRVVVDALRAAGTVDRAVSLHSIGKKVLLPYGGRWAHPTRWPELHAAASAIAARMPEPYDVKQSSRWLPGAFAHGMELDWLHDELGALAVLVECTLGGTSARAPSSWIDPFRWFNPPDPARRAGAIADAVEPFVRGD